MTFRTTKPLKRKVGPCDSCRSAEEVEECFFPYTEAKGKGTGQWIDLCSDCRSIVGGIPQRCVTLEKGIWDYLPLRR